MIQLPLKDYQELLRDYFAAKAMQGLLLADSRQLHTAEVVSSAAYAIADAMLKERSK